MIASRRCRPDAGTTSGTTALPHLLLGACLPLAATALLGVLGLLGAAPLPVPTPQWTVLTAATCLVCALAATVLLRGRAVHQVEVETRTVAHELRSSLTLPLAHLDAAMAPERTATQVREDVARAARAIERTEALVGHLLLGSDDPSASGETVDLHALTVSALTDFTPLARGRGLAVSMSADEETDYTLAGDARGLRQLLDNLLSNAIKYADADSWIDITLAGAPDQVHLTVTNAGTSSTSDEDESLFETAYRGSRAAERADGQGMGLAVVRSMARLHGGEASLHSDSLTGTTRVNVDVARFHPRFHPAPTVKS